MGKSNHRSNHLHYFSGFLLLFLVFFGFNSSAQLAIKGQMHYDVEEGWSEVAKIRVLQDNKEFETLETKKSGKFKLFLPLGHYYLIEVSKDYHFTTKFVFSTKMPQDKLDEKPFLTYNLEGDLIRAYSGLDGSIMDKPILIYRYIEEHETFELDDAHLKAVRERVERLMDESEKLKAKGVTPVAKPLPQQAKKVEEKKPEIKEAPVIEKEEMISSTTHDEEKKEERLPPPPVAEKKPEVMKEEVLDFSEDEKENANETYEMEMRRQRLEREKKKKANLALKRGYESSLIRQVAEENRRMSQAEIQEKSREKEDSSLVEKARKEAEMKRARNEKREEDRIRELKASQNKQTKSKMESGMIREVAASSKVIQASAVAESKVEGEETIHGKKYILEPKVRENEEKDDFKKVENLFLDYPSYSIVYSKETYNFGMINYYIDSRAVEKERFCEELNDLKSYKFNLKCN